MSKFTKKEIGQDEEEFKFKGTKISSKRIEKVWKTVSKRPFYKELIQGYILPEEEFFKTLEQMKKSPHFKDKSEKEWGEKLTPEGTSAVIFVSDEPKGFIILVRKNPKIKLDEELKHELEHIDKDKLAKIEENLVAT